MKTAVLPCVDRSNDATSLAVYYKILRVALPFGSMHNDNIHRGDK